MISITDDHDGHFELTVDHDGHFELLAGQLIPYQAELE